jgi:hypothetical protein
MSREPVRLLHEGGLSSGERALLEAHDDGAPYGYDVDAGALRFKGSLAALTAVGALTTAHGASRASAALGGKGVLLNVAVKVILGVATGAGLFTGGMVVGTRMVANVAPPPPSAVAASVAATTPAIPPAPGVTLAAHASSSDGVIPLAAPPSALRSATSAPRPSPPGSTVGAVGTLGDTTPHAQSVTVRSVSPAAAATAAPVPVAQASSVAPAASVPGFAAATPPAPPDSRSAAGPQVDSLSELRALAVARGLVDRDPEAALVALDGMRHDYPRGYFVEERRALTVLALAGAGRSSAAHEQAAAFLRAFPNGPFSERVRAVLAATR